MQHTGLGSWSSVQGCCGTTSTSEPPAATRAARVEAVGRNAALEPRKHLLADILNLIFLPLLVQRLKLNSWKGTESVPVMPMKRPWGSWQLQSRRWVRATLPAPCLLLGPFLPLMEQSIPPGSDQNPHWRFAAVVTGEISILLKYLLCVSVSCTAVHCTAASPKIHPLLQL